MAFPYDWHKSLIRDFALSINSNQLSFVSGKEALKVHELIDALISSSKNGKRIKVK